MAEKNMIRIEPDVVPHLRAAAGIRGVSMTTLLDALLRQAVKSGALDAVDTTGARTARGVRSELELETRAIVESVKVQVMREVPSEITKLLDERVRREIVNFASRQMRQMIADMLLAAGKGGTDEAHG